MVVGCYSPRRRVVVGVDRLGLTTPALSFSCRLRYDNNPLLFRPCLPRDGAAARAERGFCRTPAPSGAGSGVVSPRSRRDRVPDLALTPRASFESVALRVGLPTRFAEREPVRCALRDV